MGSGGAWTDGGRFISSGKLRGLDVRTTGFPGARL
jgi:hypothetical protein